MATKSLNIAMVCDFFHPVAGGVENHIFMLASNLIRRGHKVIIITHSHPSTRHGIRWMIPGIKVYHIPFKTLVSSATLPNFLTFLPYLRPILLRERIDLVHGHASLSSLAHEGILHSHLLGARTVFTDHSLFGFDDATGILTNKLLEAALRNVDAVICVSNTGRENTVLRASLHPSIAHVIPNAVIAEQFRPSPTLLDTTTINIVVVSRLAYRKGVDLLVATAPRICSLFPNVNFIVGGDGPKLVELLQMREKHMLQDRITLLGPIRHKDVREVLIEGSIFLNTSLTEAFCIGILEAACAGLYVVSTRVGGVPEVLPEDMISFAEPEEDDVVRALSDAISHVSRGNHDPHKAHERVRGMYDWAHVAERTEVVYRGVLDSEPRELWDRIKRTASLGIFAGPIFMIILVVDCYFFMFLEWLMPREDLHYVEQEWDTRRFTDICRDELQEQQA
ncbi:glycosyltransferase family 4 protein [Botryobasidium botryosum FD-172 SS1]|uniref:phosphatidylinositol N-acetylglucosaminyltransferase n=1 Tax=Botryobasidium botryosum (strain FD-172 SS1) TaxID=930990 RepID=A0A067M415_BOTB1|nr:glycosyltransferase family 4 protein [Botryobasidium botryosum FD-172 SS1]